MKNLFKLVGVITVVAVIGFSMAACDDGNDNGGNSTYTFIFSNVSSYSIDVSCSDLSPSDFTVGIGQQKTASSSLSSVQVNYSYYGPSNAINSVYDASNRKFTFSDK